MKRKFYRAGFAAYLILMLWLLFIRHRGIPAEDYWGQLCGRVNLVPFSSMGSMLRALWYNPYPSVLWTVIYNIGGNIVMFVPLGFFLRALFPKCRSFWRCMGTVAVIMSVVELCQLFTLRGFCEVDDVMLNLLGRGHWLLERKKELLQASPVWSETKWGRWPNEVRSEGVCTVQQPPSVAARQLPHPLRDRGAFFYPHLRKKEVSCYQGTSFSEWLCVSMQSLFASRESGSIRTKQQREGA